MNGGPPCPCLPFTGFHVPFDFFSLKLDKNTFRKKNLFQGYLVPVETLFSLFLIIVNNCHFTNCIISLTSSEQCFLVTLLIATSGTNHFLSSPRPPLGELTVKVRRLTPFACWFHEGIPNSYRTYLSWQ